jgi:hypothetical protein
MILTDLGLGKITYISNETTVANQVSKAFFLFVFASYLLVPEYRAGVYATEMRN